MDHVTIFNSRPMPHQRWSFLWQKIGNGWKLLAVVTKSFVLNVTGLLDPTLKSIDKMRLRQLSIPSAIYIFKVSKKQTRTTCQIYSKVVIKTSERHLVLLLLTLNIFVFIVCIYFAMINMFKIQMKRMATLQTT